MRRQVQPFQPFAGFPNFPAFPQAGQGTGSFVSTSQVTSLDNRFAGEDPVVTGQSTFITQNKDGKVQQSTTYLRPDGSTYTQTNNSKLNLIIH
jgi:hypothetical protein